MGGADITTSEGSGSLGDRLRESRCHARLTLREMGERLGVSSAVVNGYEREATDVPDTVISTYADVTGVGADWLRTGAGTSPLLPGTGE